jgi:hypothetical protein
MNRKRQRFEEHGGSARIAAIMILRLLMLLFGGLATAAQFVYLPVQLLAAGRAEAPVFAAGATPNITQAKIDIALSAFSNGYRNNSLVADRLFPRTPVGKQSDKYWVWSRENMKVDSNDTRAPGAGAQRIEPKISTDNYFCEDHALGAIIPDEERPNFEAGDIEQVKNQLVMDRLLLNWEKEVADAAAVTGNYDAANNVTLAGASQWSDYGNSDPLGDIDTAKQQVMLAGISPADCIAIMNPQVWFKFRKHPAVLDEFKYTQSKLPSMADIASLLEVKEVVVASAVSVDKNAANPAFLWGKHFVLAYSSSSSNLMDPSFGKCFTWTGAPGTVGGFATEIGRLDPPSARGDEISVHWYRGKKIASKISAYLIKNAVA